jgi:transcriptional regulator with XRE-family HTH domain
MTRRTTDFDVILGQKIRDTRIARGLTQTDLGAMIGLTFQQVQKYEKGVNRVAVGRLLEISKALEVDMSSAISLDQAPAFSEVRTDDQARLLSGFGKLSKAKKALVLNLVDQLAPCN